MEEVRICDYCGRVLAEEEGTPVDDELLCDDCVEEHCVTCDHCGETIWEQNSVSDEDTCLCQDCFDAHYYRCESCGQIVPESIVCWHSDLPYCERCFDEFEDEIEEYGYKPTPIFYGQGKRYFGVELEVDEGGKDNDNAASLKSIANVHEENIYIKSDGSLEDGFEIVSHPMTLDYHMESMNWKELLREAVAMGYRSHQTSTCGLHVHVNRNAFGDNQAEQEDVISRILFFVEKHWNELFTFSRRSSYNMSRWSARFGFEKTGKQILEKAKSGCNGRYVAVNLNNYHTIEFRLFRGTLKYNTFIATLQMVNHICDAAISLSEEGIDAMSWSEFVSSIEEPELIQYLKERRLYVNEAELVEGSFVFTVLKNDNTLFLVKGNNPLTVYHFPKIGLYVYASTKSILDNALKKVKLNDKYCEVDASEGEIIEITPDGKLNRSDFEMQDYIHTMFNPYNWDYAKWRMEDEREELLLEYCGTFGVSEEEVELLLEVGYDPDEIEELLMDTAAMEEAISEAKTLLQCEA